jgi:hypothetical protein
MIVDDELRHSLGDRRFNLPDEHPAHRRMRELLMSEEEIVQFESFHQVNNQVRWDHNRLEELGLVRTRGEFGLFSKSGINTRPKWYLFGHEEREEGLGIDNDQRDYRDIEDYKFEDGHHQFRFNVDRLLANRTPLAAALATDGTEALAWYIPFHSNSDKWGIYIRDIGPRVIANRCFPDLVRTNPVEAHELAYDFLFAHEFFHHISELACTTLENADPSNPLYHPYFRRLVSGNTNEVLEEALANSHALDFIPMKKNKDGLRQFMDDCPPGYRDYADFSNKLRFERGLDWLASMFTGKKFSRSNRYSFGHGLFSHPNSILNRMNVPLHDTEDKSPFSPALPMCVFNNITPLNDVLKRIKHKRTPIDVKKQFKKSLQKLRGLGALQRSRRLNKTARKLWFFWDVTASWRMSLVEVRPGDWEVNFIGNHTEYDRFRFNNNLN